MQKTRRRIHTATKVLVRHDLLPEKYLSQLHRSQVSRYRNMNMELYFGSELFRFSEGVMAIARQAAQNDFDRKMVQAYFRLALAFRSAFVNAKHFHKTLHTHREEVVEAVQRAKDTIGVESSARLLGVSESTLRSWIREVRVRCSDSLINMCRRVHPSQLLHAETMAMRKLLTDERFRFWSLRSLYYHALREKIVTMCRSTWYKYVKLLGIKRLKPKRSKSYGEGIRASKPNGYWHADVTKYKTGDGQKHYIYTVVDNYSRFPLAVKRSDKLSGKIRAQTFREALRTAVELHPSPDTINLLVDGGSENFNGSVDEFLREVNHIPIHRIRAIRDIHFSNSMAESLNHTLKCSYLNHMENGNQAMLDRNLAYSITDYSRIRPHGALNGLTPFEAYTGKRSEEFSFTSQIASARKDRVKANQKDKCPACKF